MPSKTTAKGPVKAPVKAAATVASSRKTPSTPTPTKQSQTPAPASSSGVQNPSRLESSASATKRPPSRSASVESAWSTAAQSATSSSGETAPGGTGNSSGKQSAPLDAKGIPNFGNGLLDLVKGYEFNEEQIIAFLHKVSTKRTDVAGTVANGISMFLLTANNNITKTLVMGQNDNVSQTKIKEASEAQLQGPNSLAMVPSIPTRGSALSTVGRPLRGSAAGRTLAFDGVDLPMITIYDYLAWLLSVLGSSEPESFEKTARNYYLPLLALFSRWCTIISSLIKFGSLPMVHIAWWDKNVLLGATLGDVPYWPSPAAIKQKIYIQPRQTKMNGLGFKQPPPVKEYGRGAVKEKQNYGHCAETFFFIVAKTKGLDKASVKGFAMLPADVSDLPMNQAIKSATSGLEGDAAAFDLTYQKLQQYKTASLHLADPCAQSCQVLFRQLGWNWRQGFAKSAWQVPLGTSAVRLESRGRKRPEQVGVGGVGVGDALKELKKIPSEMIENTAATLATPVLSAAAQGVISHVTKTYGKQNIQRGRYGRR